MTDHATNAAKSLEDAITCDLIPELDHLIDTGGGGSDFSWKGNPTQVIYDFLSRHRSARERELEEGVQRLLDAIFACQKDRDGGYDALASAWWDVVCETAEEIRRSRK